MREGRAEGYGVAPRAAARRAAQVKAVTRSTATPERPMAWVVLCGLVAVVALLYLIWSLAQYWSGGEPDLVRFVVFGALYGFGVWGFCYGWELYDVRKATRLAVILGIFGLAILIVGALVLVALAKASDGDMDIDLSGIGKALGGAGRRAAANAENVAEVVAPMVRETYGEYARARDEAWLDEQQLAAEARLHGAPGLASAISAAEGPPASPFEPSLSAGDGPAGHACRACGQAFDPAGRLGCPFCGSPA